MNLEQKDRLLKLYREIATEDKHPLASTGDNALLTYYDLPHDLFSIITHPHINLRDYESELIRDIFLAQQLQIQFLQESLGRKDVELLELTDKISRLEQPAKEQDVYFIKTYSGVYLDDDGEPYLEYTYADILDWAKTMVDTLDYDYAAIFKHGEGFIDVYTHNEDLRVHIQETLG